MYEMLKTLLESVSGEGIFYINKNFDGGRQNFKYHQLFKQGYLKLHNENDFLWEVSLTDKAKAMRKHS